MFNKFIFLFLFFPLSFFAQKGNSELDLNNLNFNLIEAEFMEKLNKLRAEQKLEILNSDINLKKAAKDQADYQHKNHIVTHSQADKTKDTPQKRVFFYNGTNDNVGENCIKIPLKKNFTAKYKKEVFVKTYSDAGEALFLGWKNSPGHYKNMIGPNYQVSGLGFSLDKDSSYLYCAQVFSSKPFIPSREFESPADAYGIKESFAGVCQIMNTNEGRKAMENIHLEIGEDSIYLRSENINTLKKFFANAADGIYFDLVQRKQFVCERNNLLHGSPIYDGRILKPAYFKDIFKRDRVKDAKNMYAAICPTPKQVFDIKVKLNFGIIKNGYSCDYTYLVSVPEKNLEILNLYPKWIYQKDLEVKPDSFDGSLSFVIPFERGEITLDDKKKKQLNEKLEIYKPFIKNINLQTFSSIEGNSQTNIHLQEQRAANISEVIKNYTSNQVTYDKQTKENWDDFFTLIKNSPFAYLNKLSKEKIKEQLKSKKLLDSLDRLLRNSRSAVLTIKLRTYIDNNSNPYLLLAAYKKSVENGDSLKAFTHQNKILGYIARYEFNRSDLLPVEIPLIHKFLPHLTNYLAIAVKEDELVYSQQARDLAIRASKIDSSYLPVVFNSCIMAIRYLQEFQDTIYPIPRLENKMNACFKLGTFEDSVITNHMWLNYHIISVYRNWQKHFYQNIDKHLSGIKNHYPGAQISEQEAIRLGLLFNLYARYTWTYELLIPYVRNKTKNEDLLFLFVETYAASHSKLLAESDWEKYLRKAKAMNSIRFYKWIDEENFQLLRDDLIKKEFCEIKR